MNLHKKSEKKKQIANFKLKKNQFLIIPSIALI